MIPRRLAYTQFGSRRGHRVSKLCETVGTWRARLRCAIQLTGTQTGPQSDRRAAAEQLGGQPTSRGAAPTDGPHFTLTSRG